MSRVSCQFMALALKQKEKTGFESANGQPLRYQLWSLSSPLHSHPGQPNPTVLSSHLTSARSKSIIPRPKRKSLSSHCPSTNLALPGTTQPERRGGLTPTNHSVPQGSLTTPPYSVYLADPSCRVWDWVLILKPFLLSTVHLNFNVFSVLGSLKFY